MKRIDGEFAVADLFGTGKPGFGDGNPLTAVRATRLNAKFFNGVQESLIRVQEAAGQVETENPGQFLTALQYLIQQYAGIRAYPLSGLPSTNVGPIVVTDVNEIWNWSTSAYFTGYRSMLCGEPAFSANPAPLPIHVDGLGGNLPMAGPYAGLWGKAQESNLVVPLVSWTPGIFKYADNGNGTFRTPDMRDVFWRPTGTDADTANARTLGSGQLDAQQGHRHRWSDTNVTTASATFISGGSAAYAGSGSQNALYVDGTGSGTLASGGFGTPRVSSENRSRNVAFHPRIHI